MVIVDAIPSVAITDFLTFDLKGDNTNTS